MGKRKNYHAETIHQIGLGELLGEWEQQVGKTDRIYEVDKKTFSSQRHSFSRISTYGNVSVSKGDGWEG